MTTDEEWERELFANKTVHNIDKVFDHPITLEHKHDIRNYSFKALNDELQIVASSSEGGRNHQLNISALKLGSLVAAGGLSVDEVLPALFDAAMQAGLGEAETRGTIRSGFEYGLQNPREVENTDTLLNAFLGGIRAQTPTVTPITPQAHENASETHTEPLSDIDDEDPPSPYVDLTWAEQGGTREPTLPSIGWRNDDQPILYKGKINGIYGDPETAKTWFALHLASQIMHKGGTVALIDIDHNGDSDTVDRMRKLGVHNTHFNPHTFRYYAPETPQELLAVRQDIIEQQPTLVIMDSIGELLPLLGQDSNSNDEISRAYRAMLLPLAQPETAVLTIDHLAKAGKSDHAYAIGGIAKKRIINGAYYHAEAITIPAPGIVGKIRINITKDRPGGVRANAIAGTIGNLILDSTAADKTVQATLASTIGSPLRPVNTMERISRLLEREEGTAMHKATIIKNGITVKAATLDQALKVLVDENYVTTQQVSGKTVYLHASAYRVIDEEIHTLNQ